MCIVSIFTFLEFHPPNFILMNCNDFLSQRAQVKKILNEIRELGPLLQTNTTRLSDLLQPKYWQEKFNDKNHNFIFIGKDMHPKISLVKRAIVRQCLQALNPYNFDSFKKKNLETIERWLKTECDAW